MGDCLHAISLRYFIRSYHTTISLSLQLRSVLISEHSFIPSLCWHRREEISYAHHLQDVLEDTENLLAYKAEIDNCFALVALVMCRTFELCGQFLHAD